MKSCLNCFVLLLLINVNLIYAYDSRFVFASVSNPKTGITRKYCVNHQTDDVLPTSPESATPVRIAYLTKNTSNTDICAPNATPFKENVIVPINYTTFSMSATCLGRTNVSSFMNAQARYLQKLNVDKVLFLVVKGEPVEVTQGYHKYLFSVFHNPELTEKEPDTYYIYYDTFFDSIMDGVKDSQYTDLSVSFYRPKSFPFDGSELIILTIAVVAIVSGSMWSMKIMTDEDIKAARLTTSDSIAEEGVLKEPNGSDSPSVDGVETNGVNHQDNQMTMTQQVITVAITVVLIFAILIMSFFFRDVAIWFFNIFLAVFGTYSIYKCLMALVCFEESKKLSLSMICCNIINNSFLKKRFGFFNLFAFLFASSISITWFVIRREYYAFYLLNFINICLCICAVHTCQIRNLKIITMLLIGMFVYDIIMVFGTKLLTPNGCSVMLQVVTGVDCNAKPSGGLTYPIAPVEMSRPERMPLLFYVPLVNDVMQECYDVETEVEYRHIMLGLGDVIVPGYLIVFCFFVDKLKGTKYYGMIALCGYIIGLVSTFLALRFMKMAQPALIYLVPFTLIPIIVTSFVKGHFKEIWYGKFKVDI